MSLSRYLRRWMLSYFQRPVLIVSAAVIVLHISTMTITATEPGSADWPHWGGPERSFKTDSTGLLDSWPEGGPPRLWSRPLGEGYSAIVVRDAVLYTLYRQEEREIVIALSAATGETKWEFGYDSPTEGYRFDRGAGPHATPAVAGDRLFSVGSTTVLNALSSADGSLLWSYELAADFDSSYRHRGYATSPLVYGELVLVPVGGKGRTLVAFRQDDGSEVWRGGDEDIAYASPTLIEVDGQEQVVAFVSDSIVGLDPASGRELWKHAHPTKNAFSISTPLFSEEAGILFLSSAYDGGGRGLKLRRDGGATRVEELWFSNQVRVHFGTAILVGDTVYCASGDFGPAPMAAVDLNTGEVLWRDRAFAKHSAVYADGKLILLDEDGVLGLATVTREGLEVLSRAQVFDSLAWTVPTLVGTRLYLRNREEIVALELGD